LEIGDERNWKRLVCGEQVNDETRVSQIINEEIIHVHEDGEGVYVVATLNGGMARGASRVTSQEIYFRAKILTK